MSSGCAAQNGSAESWMTLELEKTTLQTRGEKLFEKMFEKMWRKTVRKLWQNAGVIQLCPHSWAQVPTRFECPNHKDHQ